MKIGDVIVFDQDVIIRNNDYQKGHKFIIISNSWHTCYMPSRQLSEIYLDIQDEYGNILEEVNFSRMKGYVLLQDSRDNKINKILK